MWISFMKIEKNIKNFIKYRSKEIEKILGSLEVSKTAAEQDQQYRAIALCIYYAINHYAINEIQAFFPSVNPRFFYIFLEYVINKAQQKKNINISNLEHRVLEWAKFLYIK